MRKIQQETLTKLIKIRDNKISARKRRFRRLVKNTRKLKCRKNTWLNILAPEKFLFYGDDSQKNKLQEFISIINDSLLKGRKVRLNFNNTAALHPCGVLIFIGWLEDWINKYPEKITCNYPKLDMVEQMLQSLGVIEKLGLRPKRSINHNDVIRWHQFRGTNVDTTPMEKFMEEIRELAGKNLQMGLGDCINEAIANVIDHAYEGKNVPKNWWMFSTINKEKRQILVAIHDRGDSIPATIINKPTLKDYFLLRKIRRNIDKDILCAAVGGRTRTKLYYRGKGLPEMLEFSRSNLDNVLAIYSRKGYFYKRSGGTQEESGTFLDGIKGTLVIWGVNF